MTFGETPSCSARTIVGVPCMSLPPTMSTSSPFIRWYRAKMSAGMNVETAWPRCRGPDVYGHAAQTRIFAMRGESKKGGAFKPFAGGTGGVYGSDRKSRSRTTSTTRVSSAPPRRTLLEIVEDLHHVNDVTTSVRGRPREKELSVRLYQCPTCGRFVSEQSTECVCGVRFAPMSSVTFSCPDCGSRVPSDVDACPVCSRGFTPSGGAGDYVYACPRCGVHVTSDAVRCSCGAWFED